MNEEVLDDTPNRGLPDTEADFIIPTVDVVLSLGIFGVLKVPPAADVWLRCLKVPDALKDKPETSLAIGLETRGTSFILAI
jgi:hypothetical protein